MVIHVVDTQHHLVGVIAPLVVRYINRQGFPANWVSFWSESITTIISLGGLLRSVSSVFSQSTELS